jgi:hypothetical protein
MDRLMPAKNKGDCPECLWRKTLYRGLIQVHPLRDMHYRVVRQRCPGSLAAPLPMLEVEDA